MFIYFNDAWLLKMLEFQKLKEKPYKFWLFVLASG
jgi:hypothetical protein